MPEAKYMFKNIDKKMRLVEEKQNPPSPKEEQEKMFDT
jgi:hypothetical protein